MLLQPPAHLIAFGSPNQILFEQIRVAVQKRLYIREVEGCHDDSRKKACKSRRVFERVKKRDGFSQETVLIYSFPVSSNPASQTLALNTNGEHPYSSHISRFAMFPSFLSPDDPERGVRAASQRFTNPLIPNKPPDVTLLSKTIGGPYRHEILENPFKSRKMDVSWKGENEFLDVRETKIFYPAPPKTILPNPKLRRWDLSLSERTSNILRNLERKLWITSYQMDFTGSGPANPLKTDDFKEKISSLTGINSHSAPLVNHVLQFCQSHTNSMEELQKEDPQIKKQSLRVGNPLRSELHDALSSKEDDKTNGSELLSSLPNVSILPRGSVFLGVPTNTFETAGRTGTNLTLLDLQNSFSKSEAHQRFNNSITHAAVDLRDNVVTGKRHNFYGINCNHIHG
uniref:Uncharacterized protein n=1 Tax=Xiphophorus couchianus TaxID=32473 RepID=A0A3B5N0C3_9TELE